VISDETRGADGYNQRFTVEKMLKVNEDLGVKTSFKADLSQYTT
jgi:hypothetical protein